MYKTVSPTTTRKHKPRQKKSRSPSPVTVPMPLSLDQSNIPHRAAAQSIFSFLLDSQVIFDDTHQASKLDENSDINLIFQEIYQKNWQTTELCLQRGDSGNDAPPPPGSTGGMGMIFITTYNNRKLFFTGSNKSTVREIKEYVNKRLPYIPIERQILIYNSKEWQDDQTIRDIGADLKHHSYFFYVVLRENTTVQRILSSKVLDPPLDYDFTNTDDTGQVFYRGGYEYKRPCGWQRLALNVKGKFGSDTWLGSTGKANVGEWPVAYHGTDYSGMYGICNNGFQLKYVKRALYGKGHYTTPSVDIANDYTTLVSYGGHLIRFILQCRVDSNKMKVFEIPNYGYYWLLPGDADLRPYGLCYMA